MAPSFNILKLTTELSSQYAGAPSKPHRHDYEEIIIVTQGNPQLFIDLIKESLLRRL